MTNEETNTQMRMCTIIQERFDDALQDLHQLKPGHPDESRLIERTKTLKKLKHDLKRNGLWIVI